MDVIFLTIIPGIIVFMILMAVYKGVLEKRFQSQEHLEFISNSTGQGAGQIYSRDSILKKRADKNSRFYALEVRLERANLLLEAHEFFVICLASGAVGFILVFSSVHNIFVGILAGLVCCFAPYAVLWVKIILRLKKAEDQFPDVLDTLTSCFKTGYGFSRAIQVIMENFDDPWGTEFGKMSVEMNLGASSESVLRALPERVPLADVDLFVSSLLIQKDTGGNLVELLNNLAQSVRSRHKLFRKISALAAQGKLSATIVSLVPVVIMGLMYMFVPGPAAEFIANPIGVILLIIFGIWMLVGVFVLSRIVQIEV